MKVKSLLFGICLALGLSGCDSHTESKMVSPRFNHVLISVTDMERSVAFYTTAFDLEVTNRLTKLEATEADGTTAIRDINIVLLKFPGQDFVYEMVERPAIPDSLRTLSLFQHVGVDVQDIEVAFERVAAAGGKVISPIKTVRANDIIAKQAFFSGPDGEQIELMQILSGSF